MLSPEENGIMEPLQPQMDELRKLRGEQLVRTAVRESTTEPICGVEPMHDLERKLQALQDNSNREKGSPKRKRKHTKRKR